jgi:hypothetical protein
MGPLYIVTERFGPASGAAWQRYMEWSGLTQLVELVSLDSILCPTVLPEIAADDWPHIVNADFLLHYFHDLDYLMKRVGHLNNRNQLCVYRDPESPPSVPAGRVGFEFKGYDLIDVGGGTSALTNCGGFPNAFDNSELSSLGLLPTLDRAREVQESLLREYPDEPHAECNVWALFRHVEASLGLN